MAESFTNFKVFKWAVENGKSRCFGVKQQFIQSDIPDLFYGRNGCSFSNAYVMQVLKGQLEVDYILKWYSDLDRNETRTGQGGMELRTYRTFKHECGLETFIFSILPRRHRKRTGKI